MPRALFYSIYQYWVRERAKAEKRQERLKKKRGEGSDDEDGEDDPVKGLLNDAEKASDILKDYISNEKRKWRRRRAAIRADGSSQTMEEAVRHVTQNLKKIIEVTNHNLKEVWLFVCELSKKYFSGYLFKIIFTLKITIIYKLLKILAKKRDYKIKHEQLNYSSWTLYLKNQFFNRWRGSPIILWPRRSRRRWTRPETNPGQT